MPLNPFTTYNSNQRVVAIPVTPTRHDSLFITAASTITVATIVLSAANIAAGAVDMYAYYCVLHPQITAAASALNTVFVFQFRNAAHAAVGGASNVMFASCGCSAAGAAGILSPMDFYPSVPAHIHAAIPATAVEVSFDMATSAIFGAPNAIAYMGWGIDPLNMGPTGDIGGGGMAAQSATNPNTF